MEPEQKKQLFFLQVRSPREKKERIISVAHRCFERQEQLLLLAPHAEGAAYLDRLLWSHPLESFLPHTYLEESSGYESILITSHPTPTGSTIFNLTAEPLSYPFLKIYEIEDLQNPDKKKITQEHYRFYKAAGYAIVTLNPGQDEEG